MALCSPSLMQLKSLVYWRIKMIFFFFFLPKTVDLRKKSTLIFHSTFIDLSSVIHLMPQRLFMVFGCFLHFTLVSIVVLINSTIQSSLMFSKMGKGLPQWLSGKESACNEGDMGLIPGPRRSLTGGTTHSNGNPLQYSCLESPMDRGVRWAIVHRVTKSQTQPK